MYGMVNKAIEAMIRADYGETVWAATKRRAGVTQEVFVSTEAYPDEISHRLFTAAGDCTGIPADELLRRFGEYWILHTVGADYGHLFAAAGSTVGEFLSHLPRFHDRIVLLFPNLTPPRFEVTDRSPNSLRLHYTSRRPGFAAFVLGLIDGIGRRFDTPVTATVERTREQTGGTDVFLVRW